MPPGWPMPCDAALTFCVLVYPSASVPASFPLDVDSGVLPRDWCVSFFIFFILLSSFPLCPTPDLNSLLVSARFPSALRWIST
jgi:hypothetical protein